MITIDDITKKFQEVYYMPDPTPLRMIIASALSPHMDGAPVWLMLVATSGSGKTELLKCLKDVDSCYFISNMTENTLLSGSRAPGKKKGDLPEENKKETSLLLRMPKRGGMLVWPEFNTLLDERKEKRASILSQLRSVYDGVLTKETGLGDSLRWDGKIAVIGGCTEKYFTDMEELDAAGPRFTVYNLPEMSDEESRARLLKVKKNEHLFEETMVEIQDMVREFYAQQVALGIPALLDAPEEFDQIINEIALMLGVSLTTVRKDFKGQIKGRYGKVDGTRFYRTSRKLAQSLMVLRIERQLAEEDADGVVKMMFDTIPRNRHLALSIGCRYNEFNTKGLAHYLHLPTEAVKEILQELNSIGMVTRRTGDPGLGDMWTVKPKYRDLFTKYEKGTEWRGGNLLHMGDEDDDMSEMQKLPKLSIFKATDDTEHDKEVAEGEAKVVDDLFNST